MLNNIENLNENVEIKVVGWYCLETDFSASSKKGALKGCFFLDTTRFNDEYYCGMLKLLIELIFLGT